MPKWNISLLNCLSSGAWWPRSTRPPKPPKDKCGVKQRHNIARGARQSRDNKTGPTARTAEPRRQAGPGFSQRGGSFRASWRAERKAFESKRGGAARRFIVRRAGRFSRSGFSPKAGAKTNRFPMDESTGSVNRASWAAAAWRPGERPSGAPDTAPRRVFLFPGERTRTGVFLRCAPWGFPRRTAPPAEGWRDSRPVCGINGGIAG